MPDPALKMVEIEEGSIVVCLWTLFCRWPTAIDVVKDQQESIVIGVGQPFLESQT
jgi:hypothetical protein